MASTKQWMRFFLGAGIPPDSAAHYAITFEQNRMGLDMLLDLDKEYLRDLKITALGDIIAILRHARAHHARTEQEKALARQDRGSSDESKEPSPAAGPRPRTAGPSPRTAGSSPRTAEPRSHSPPATKPRAHSPRVAKPRPPSPLAAQPPARPPSPPVETGRAARIREELERTSRVEKELLKARSSSKVAVAKEEKPEAKSVFSRLGAAEKEGEKAKVEARAEPRGGASIFERLGRQEEETGRRPSTEQEPRVTSTSEESCSPGARGRASASPGRGILKKRAAGEVGSALLRSKSASNIISLKAPVKEKNMKRISFGETETRTMAPKEDVRSRLGYGRQASPPPAVTEPSVMQTKIQKIALGGGKFEMRKVMNLVKSELVKDMEEAGAASPPPPATKGRMNSAGVFASEGASGSLKVSVRNDPKPMQISVKNDLGGEAAGKRPLAGEETVARKPKKRLAMYRTLADGTVEKEYISYDDPILAKVPIQKKKSEELGSRTSVTIAKDKTASNFQVVRPALPVAPAGPGRAVTLAEKAREVRSRVEEGAASSDRSFETLASRAQRRRSVSPEAAGGRDRSPVEGGRVFARLGPRH